jgi:hypothetical protein
MMDFGYPQSTEAKVLKEYICVEERHKFVAKPPVAVTNAVSWRSEGIKHKKNEIFLDVIEKLNILVSANGTVLRSEILGQLKMKSFLSGMPELKLGLNDKVLMDSSGRATVDPARAAKSVDLEDIRFHQVTHNNHTHMHAMMPWFVQCLDRTLTPVLLPRFLCACLCPTVCASIALRERSHNFVHPP